MIARFVWADLVRNPRRTLATMVGVTLGVGLSCAVLFFVDGLSASMTQRAVAPLPIDMQRVLNDPIAADLHLAQEAVPAGAVKVGEVVQVHLAVGNTDLVPANEVIVRSTPPAGLAFVAGSATLDGEPVGVGEGNPFFTGPAGAGMNLGTMEPGATRIIDYTARASADADLAKEPFRSTVSSREVLAPITANATSRVDLGQLAAAIGGLDGVASAEQLSFADLPTGSLSSGPQTDGRPARVFGFDAGYVGRDRTIRITEGAQVPGQALLSVEASHNLGAGVGDTVAFDLPDGSQKNVTVSGVVDLSRARSLFVSRLGAHFEVFLYVPASVVVDPAMFADVVMPAYERAAAKRGEVLKSPPVREIDIGVERERLDADPGTALRQTEQIGAAVTAVADRQDFLLDNISNTLMVARGDADVAKRLFLFLGIPGGLLAAMLAAYAGNVLAGAQRREQATLRIRGASRRHLLAMLALRVSCITVVGAILGVALGYASAVAVIGNHTLTRAATGQLVTSGVLGTLIGLLATGAALYVTGRRSIDREINGDRSRLAVRTPVWRRYRLDMIGVLVVAAATVMAARASAFDGVPGSVYVGRSVSLPLALLCLPIAAWIAGGLLAGRGFGWLLRARHATAPPSFARPLQLLYRLSLRRRSWAVAEAAVMIGLIVALGTSLAVFTASYDQAKASDARYVTGSDLRISPNPGLDQSYRSTDRATFAVGGVRTVAPVVYSSQNVIIRSQRTSDPMNL
ncbi:MAG: FtsX-like permease family protein, partial [Acidimicrobiales bacterium]